MVRAAAIRGLANHGEPRHVAQITPLLTDANPMVRVEAARGLQRLHDPSAVDPLIVAVREPDPRSESIPAENEPEVRTEAAAALGQYAEDRVLRALISALDDTDLAVNRAALRSLRILTGQDLGLDSVAWESWKAKADDPFAARGLYTYPAYSRKQRLYEYIPLVPKPPNERPAPPTGLPR
jgi:HEAT repeat protein